MAHYTEESLNNGQFGTSLFGYYVHRGCSIDCPHYEVKLYYHGLVGTTEYVFYREVESIVSFIRSVL